GVVEILALIRGLARDRGVAVLLSSHLLHQVQSVCDRVGIFVRGRLVAAGPVGELAARVSGSAVRFEVGAGGEPGAVEQALRSVPAVQEVSRDERDPGRWLVTTTGDAGATLAAALVNAGLEMTHLRRRGEDLDELYRRYFEDDDRETAAVGGADGERR